MHRLKLVGCVLFGCLLCRGADLRAREVVGYYVQLTPQGQRVLLGVDVCRGKKPEAKILTYKADGLVPASVVHFRNDGGLTLIMPAGAPAPGGSERLQLLGDRCLNTGLINPGAATRPLESPPQLDGEAATPGVGVRFAQPVVNRPGDDVVLFEFQAEVNAPASGDRFFVGPLEPRPGLQAIAISSFDVTRDTPEALPTGAFDLYRLEEPSSDATMLRRAKLIRGNAVAATAYRVLAVGIDLSDLGFAAGASTRGLFFQSAAGAGGLDPLLVVGLPEATAENLLAEKPDSRLTEPQRGDLLRAMLNGPLADVDEIVYAERVCGFDHWYANFGFYSATVSEYPPQRGIEGEAPRPLFGDGGRLCRLNLRTGKRTVLLEDATGGVRDPQVHYDGRRILFSYRRGGQPFYNLYEINADGTDLRQVTDGPFDDIEPTYLPDGGIVFCSSRSKRFVNCYRTPVATLYRCNADGSGLRMLSTNIEHDNTPWPLPDGRLLYMRWEYVDRSQFDFHHLWTANPDGTGQMVYFGNQHAGYAMLDAKPIPGTDQVVASFSPGHGRPGHMGYITIIDPKTGPDSKNAARTISKPGKQYRDPYPIAEDCFLVADNRGIWVMDQFGNTDLIYEGPAPETELTCHEPRPLRSRQREPVIPSRVDLSETTGRLFLSDIYHGRNMAGVERGSIKKLLVLEQLPKPISFSGGMWPISVGGTFTLARILGTVPVEPDGSATMELPAMRSLFFVALDENDLSVKRMQSFLTLEPGETTGCVGCHERRVTAPPAKLDVAASRRKPAKPEPVPGVPDVMDFHRDVQPVLDRHCVECHNANRMEGRVNLSGEHTPLFCESYWTIMHRGLIADGRNERHGNRPPREIGSAASRLLKFFDQTHYGVDAPAADVVTVRLWIDSSAVYAGTYAALGSGMDPVEFPIEVIERRCGKCHAHDPPNPKRRIGVGSYFRFGEQGPALPLVHTFVDLQRIRGSIGYYKFGNARPPQSLCNLTHPEHSLLLRAPLDDKAGGLGWCRPAVFRSTDDEDYRTILAAIEKSAARHAEFKRFDMPGFRPNVYYIRMMQEYGVLPADLSPDEPVDFYSADRAYWESFYPEPQP